MPLHQSGSNEARQKNIATEIAAGRDPKQAVAIGYSVQRQNGGKVGVKKSGKKVGVKKKDNDGEHAKK